ncbi:MAG: beta-galactosidase, partial [Lachnospiraceae bacterium]|nr:beta-galactosidase [Lachnospiraceae bacterium]
MKIGVDYYPEHWGEKMWAEDVASMKRAGVSVVRMAEFAWSRMEPEEGRFSFAWLDKIVSMFEKAGIDVILCTPTCTPPNWMFEKYPEIIRMGKDGRRVSLGIRGHRCLNSPVFREKAKIMIEKMVTHFKDKKNVIGWQIDNELEANHCCCPVCADKFREYLKKKYKTIDKVNEAYGNDVWSGEYSDFSQITPPFGENQIMLNPSYMLDFGRYAMESTTEYSDFQADIIRKIKKNFLITTNTWLPEFVPDFYHLFENLDFVSYDNYPTTVIPEDPEELYSHAFHLDLMRGIKKQNFWVMEELSGPIGSWMPMTPAPKPGMLKGYSLQAVAHGADAVVHFRWRTAKSGAEMFWHGLIDHNNISGRRFEEFCNLCETVKELDIPENAVIKNKAAILYGPLEEYAFKIQPQVDGMYYFRQLRAYHDALMANGVGVDVIDVHSLDQMNEREKGSVLSQYKLVIAPILFVTEESWAKTVEDFVRGGGHFVLTNRSGVKDANNQCVSEVLPGIFAELAGAYVTEYDPIGPKKQKFRISKSSSKQGSLMCVAKEDADSAYAKEEITCSLWCDLLEAENAEVLAVYGEQFYENAPAVTRNHFGQGE